MLGAWFLGLDSFGGFHWEYRDVSQGIISVSPLCFLCEWQRQLRLDCAEQPAGCLQDQADCRACVSWRRLLLCRCLSTAWHAQQLTTVCASDALPLLFAADIALLLGDFMPSRGSSSGVLGAPALILSSCCKRPGMP